MVTSLHHLRYHYLPLFAKAVKGLFPGVDLLGGGLTDHGFFYDFVLSGQTVDQQAVQSIEERISQLLYEGVAFSFVEMLRDIAANFLASRQQNSKALILRQKYSPGLMGFLNVDGFLEYLPEPIDILPSNQLKHFSLLEVVHFSGECGEVVTRVEGTAFFTSKELKEFKKKKKGFVGFDHLTLAKEMKLFHYDPAQGEGVWLPKGVEWLHLYFDQWKKMCSSLGIQEVKTCAIDEDEFFDKAQLVRRFSGVFFGEILLLTSQYLPEECKGMWRLNRWLADRTLFFVKWNDVQDILISSLQFILKTVNILCSDSCWVITSPAIRTSSSKQGESPAVLELRKALEFFGLPYTMEFVEGEKSVLPRAYCLIADGLGRRWKGPFIGVRPSPITKDGEAGEAIASCSLFGSCERIAASVLELYKGAIPLKFAPEQVRLAAMPNLGIYTQSLEQRLREEGFRVGVDLGKASLAEKIHNAEKEKVPYIAIIGEREMQMNSLSIRSGVVNNRQRSVTIDGLLDELHRENRKENNGNVEIDSI